MEWLKTESMESIIMVVMGINIMLSAAGKILDMVKDKTESNTDNKALVIVNKIAAVLTKLLDWTGANRKH